MAISPQRTSAQSFGGMIARLRNFIRVFMCHLKLEFGVTGILRQTVEHDHCTRGNHMHGACTLNLSLHA